MDENTISLAEVPLFDELLRMSYKDYTYEKNIDDILKAAISLHLQKRSGYEKQAIIKFDSWHIFFYATIRNLYPDVPCILLYRSPDEVLLSHRKHRGMQAVPGLIEPGVFGFTQQDIQHKSLDEYTAAVLERYLLKFSEIAGNDPKALLLNYNEGAMPMLEKLLAHAHVSHDQEIIEKMKARSLYHSKRPAQAFSGDEAEKEIPSCIKEAMAAYERLEAERISRF